MMTHTLKSLRFYDDTVLDCDGREVAHIFARRDAYAYGVLFAAANELLAEGLALANEVRAALTLLNETTAGEPLGWTNIACLQQHLERMDAAIAKATNQ